MFRRPNSIDGVKKPHEKAEILDAKILPWKEKSHELPEMDAEAERRQRRIIGYFCIDEKATVTPEEIVRSNSQGLRELQRERANELRRAIMQSAEPQITPEKRQIVLGKLARGEITPEDETQFLLLIKSPLTEIGAEKMFDKIKADPRQKQILAVATGCNLENWQKVDALAMTKMLTSLQTDGDDYRTPVGFRNLERHFLRGIKTRASATTYESYVRSLRELARTLYGERVDYAREFEHLRKMAQDTPEVATVAVAQPKRKLATLSEERSGEMLGRAVIDGDVWRADGAETLLSTHHLAEAKLGPTYEITLDQTKICLSELFTLTNGDTAVLAYVPRGNEIKVRTFYRPAEASLWRYLPDYLRRTGGGINRYLIGFGVTSVTLPLELQEALVRMEMKQGAKRVPKADFCAAGTAGAYDSLQDYQAALQFGRVRGDFYLEVAAEPSNHDFDHNKPGQKKAPYTLAIDYAKAPDFGAKRTEFELATAEAGVVRAESFATHDGQGAWLFARTKNGRAWVERVEVLSPLTSLGLRRDWAEMGDFTTALYEHTNRAGIYGDRSDMKGARQGMWKNYLSNVPLIQEYLRACEK